MAEKLSTQLRALVIPVNQVLSLLQPFRKLTDVFAVTLHWWNWNERLV